MIRLISIWLACIGLISLPAAAHDFWLQPKQFKISSPDEMSVGFKVGHHHDSEDWDLQKYRMVQVHQYDMQGTRDLGDKVIEKTSITPGLVIADLSEVGTHIIAFESRHSLSELAAEKFNDYAESEGLLAIIAKRESDQLMQTPGIEIYSRRAKTLIQVGDNFTDNAMQTIGHTLEIVPVQHPFEQANNQQMAVKVYFMGKPLSEATVDLMALNHHEDGVQVAKTNKEGVATFNMPRHGKWLFNVVWGVPIQANLNADFETYFASLTLGFE